MKDSNLARLHRIEKQLGYTYAHAPLEHHALLAAAVPLGNSAKVIRVSGVNRASIRGSFLISAFMSLRAFREETLRNAGYEIQISARDGILNRNRASPAAFSLFEKKAFDMEIR